MRAKTAAEQQIELLRQLKEAKPKRKATPVPAPASVSRPAAPMAHAPGSGEAAFELAEGGRTAKPKSSAPALPVSRETWRRLKERQRLTREFKRRSEMGEWAAELLLALPPQTHRLSPEAKAELFKRMAEWCQARGLA